MSAPHPAYLQMQGVFNGRSAGFQRIVKQQLGCALPAAVVDEGAQGGGKLHKQPLSGELRSPALTLRFFLSTWIANELSKTGVLSRGLKARPGRST
jgi:hypothetical protein